MGKQQHCPGRGAVLVVGLLTISLIYAAFYASDDTILLKSGKNSFSHTREVDQGKVEGEAWQDLLRKLVAGEEEKQLDNIGFSCHSDVHTDMCLTSKPVRITNKGLTVYVSSDGPRIKHTVLPYARKDDEGAMKMVTPVQILQGETNQTACNFTHNLPAVVFSSGVTGNAFHEFSEIIVPLFLTCRQFKSHVKFVITDYKELWVEKYKKVFSHLSRYEVLNLAEDASVHCFPGAIVGLRYHDNLALNSSYIPLGYSISEFRQFLREVYSLKVKDVSEIKKPVLVLISRRKTRIILNEEAVVQMMEELGFQVVITGPSVMSNLELFSGILNACSVMVGFHGAGLTNEIFLSDRAVVVEVVGLGLEWASMTYFRDPGIAMGLQYLQYKIEPLESSLSKKYGLDHPVITDPMHLFKQGYKAVRAVYVDGQNVTINLARFKETLKEAMKILGHQVASE